MATLVLGTVGSAVGGPLGALIGSTIGRQIDQAVFLGGEDTTREGPRLSDTEVQSSALGSPIPLVFGTARIAGNVLWTSGLKEERTETEQGGGKGGRPSTTTVEFSYHASVAVGLSARPIKRVERIWADGKLLRDREGNLLTPVTIRVYTGEETQEPDPLLQANETVARTPPFRGLAYVVLEELQLGEFANRIPNLSFEVVADEPATLGGILQDLAGMARLERASASGLDGQIDGLAVARNDALRNVMESVLATFPVVVSEGPGHLLFRPRDGGAQKSVGEASLGAAPESEAPAERALVERRQGGDLPLQFDLRYGDPARDYQPAVQRVRRQLGHTHRRDGVDSPLILTAARAKAQADRLLALAWQKQESHTVQLPLDFAELEPGDRLAYQLDGKPVDLLIEEMELAPGRVRIAGSPLQAFAALESGAESGDVPAQPIFPPDETRFEFLDFPGIGRNRERPNALLAAAGPSAAWRGAGLFVSRDDGASFDLLTSVDAPAVMGEVTAPPGEGSATVWDEASAMEVQLLRSDMELESRSALSVLNGANRAVVGNELVQFREADLLSDGSYRLSGLLRGREGTEAAIAGHESGERFVLLDGGGLKPLEMPREMLGQSVEVKPVTRDSSLESTAAKSVFLAGRSVQPLSPVHVRAARSDTGDLSMRWIRRSRNGGGWLDGADVPLAEEREAYEIDILENAAPVRTISAQTPQAVYTADQQIADFGAVQSAVDVAIYQMSALVGRGEPWTGTL